MPNDFAGIIQKPGESSDIFKVEDKTPTPPKPAAPKPPEGWDTTHVSYKMARDSRKK